MSIVNVLLFIIVLGVALWAISMILGVLSLVVGSITIGLQKLFKKNDREKAE